MSPSLAALFSLNKKSALLTGAGSGIGRQMAIALAAAGATVHLLGRRRQPLEETAELIGAEKTVIVEADLLAIEQWDDFVAHHRLTDMDIIGNVAGVNRREPYAKISSDSWDATLNLNLKIPFFLARAIVPFMQKKRWGKIINIASLQSYRAFADGIPYGASKGGVAQLTRAMAEAWSADGITCNAIAPGFFPTELTAPIFGAPALSEKMAQQTAVKRNGKMDDLNGLSVFLASPASDYITGQVIALDGGFTAK